MNEEKKIKTFSKDHWFWGAIFDNKSILPVFEKL